MKGSLFNRTRLTRLSAIVNICCLPSVSPPFFYEITSVIEFPRKERTVRPICSSWRIYNEIPETCAFCWFIGDKGARCNEKIIANSCLASLTQFYFVVQPPKKGGKIRVSQHIHPIGIGKPTQEKT